MGIATQLLKNAKLPGTLPAILWSIILVAAPSAHASILYNNIHPAQSQEWSWPFAAESTSQFGGLVELASSPASLQTAVVQMSNWAPESDWEAPGTSAGYSVPMTLNLYNVGSDYTVGGLFSTVTVNAFIPWRPEADPTNCGAGTTQYLGMDSQCHDGSLSTVTFNLAGISAPAQFIFGVALDTSNDGPYDSLNISLSTDDPTIGTNPLPDTVYLNTSIDPFYTDGGPSGTFRQDQGWAPYGAGAIAFDGVAPVPEPSTLLLMAFSAVGLGIMKYRSRA